MLSNSRQGKAFCVFWAKFQPDSSSEKNLNGFLAPDDGSHPATRESLEGVGEHCRPGPGGSVQEGRG